MLWQQKRKSLKAVLKVTTLPTEEVRNGWLVQTSTGLLPRRLLFVSSEKAKVNGK